MLHLMKKNSLFFILYAGSFLPFLILYWITSSGPFSTGNILFQGQLVIILVLGSLAVNEQHEEKSNGYEFLKNLPIYDKEIVASKFALVFLTTVVMIVFHNLLYIFTSGPPHLFVLGRIFLIFCGNFALLFSACMYIFIYKFGHAKFLRLVWVIVICFFIVPFLMIEKIFLKIGLDIDEIVMSIVRQNWLVWVLMSVIGFSIFLGLMQIVIKIKTAESN